MAKTGLELFVVFATSIRWLSPRDVISFTLPQDHITASIASFAPKRTIDSLKSITDLHHKHSLAYEQLVFRHIPKKEPDKLELLQKVTQTLKKATGDNKVFNVQLLAVNCLKGIFLAFSWRRKCIVSFIGVFS